MARRSFKGASLPCLRTSVEVSEVSAQRTGAMKPKPRTKAQGQRPPKVRLDTGKEVVRVRCASHQNKNRCQIGAQGSAGQRRAGQAWEWSERLGPQLSGYLRRPIIVGVAREFVVDS